MIEHFNGDFITKKTRSIGWCCSQHDWCEPTEQSSWAFLTYLDVCMWSVNNTEFKVQNLFKDLGRKAYQFNEDISYPAIHAWGGGLQPRLEGIRSYCCHPIGYTCHRACSQYPQWTDVIATVSRMQTSIQMYQPTLHTPSTFCPGE